MIINFIQDVPTPHNNILIAALARLEDMKLNLWYARETHPQYSFGASLAHEIQKAKIYGYRWPSMKLLGHALFRRREKYFMVGWANPTTRLLVFLFCLLRFPYNIWFDLPNDDLSRGKIRNVMREFCYFLLRKSPARIFCVGQSVVNYFVKRNFQPERLYDFPIFVDISRSKNDYQHRYAEIHRRYGVFDGDLFISSGSRLTREKGFDLLIEAFNQLPEAAKSRAKIVIVGRGEEKDNLCDLVKRNRLEKNIIMEDWMENDDFLALIAASDVFVHPARRDAFGGGTLAAMSLGVPVIGTYQAGSPVARIQHGVNGYLYECEDVPALTKCILLCIENRAGLAAMGVKARKTAEQWTPETGAVMMKTGII